jgi:hypothetical protein
MASAAAPEMVLKRTPSVAIRACVLTSTRSCLPSIKRRFRPGRKGLRATRGRAVKISARWAAHTQHHFEIHLLRSGQILASLRLPGSSPAPRRGVCPSWGKSVIAPLVYSPMTSHLLYRLRVFDDNVAEVLFFFENLLQKRL